MLVLNSACCKSAAVGLGGDFPNMDRKRLAIKAINEFILFPKDISVILGSSIAARSGYDTLFANHCR